MKYFFFFAIIFSIVLMYLTVKKWKSEGKKMGCIGSGYIYLIIFSLSVLFFPFAGILLQKTYNSFTKSSYKSTVVASKAYQDECEDSDGNEYPCTKYITYVEFQLEDGTSITSETNIHSGDIPVIGSSLNILYEAGDNRVDELSWRSFLMYLGLLTMLFFMGSILLASLNYTLGKSNRVLWNVVLKFLLYFIVPASLVGFMVLFIWILWKYFTDVETYPIWVVMLCFLFLIFLVPATLGYIYNLTSGKGSKRKRNALSKKGHKIW